MASDPDQSNLKVISIKLRLSHQSPADSQSSSPAIFMPSASFWMDHPPGCPLTSSSSFSCQASAVFPSYPSSSSTPPLFVRRVCPLASTTSPPRQRSQINQLQKYYGLLSAAPSLIQHFFSTVSFRNMALLSAPSLITALFQHCLTI